MSVRVTTDAEQITVQEKTAPICDAVAEIFERG